jgi:hypothetical protein
MQIAIDKAIMLLLNPRSEIRIPQLKGVCHVS